MAGMGRGNAILGCQALAEKLASTTQILNRFLGIRRKIVFIQKHHFPFWSTVLL